MSGISINTSGPGTGAATSRRSRYEPCQDARRQSQRWPLARGQLRQHERIRWERKLRQVRRIVKRVDHVDFHGALWLLGDNAEASTDSRTFGAVPREAIIGRVRWRYWPLRSLFRVG